MDNLGPTPWLTLEGNKTAEDYMWHQLQESLSVQNMVAGLFDGWQIKHWDMEWDTERKVWTIEIHQDETVDVTDYYRNRPCCPECKGKPGDEWNNYICSKECWKSSTEPYRS